MSLYTAVYGMNPASHVLLEAIAMPPASLFRFRDAFIEKQEDGSLLVCLYTRFGPGLRECNCDGECGEDCYEKLYANMTEVPNYVCDVTDPFDSTYATFKYRPCDDEWAEHVKKIYEYGEFCGQAPDWEKMLGDLQSGKETAQTKRAMEFGSKVFDGILDLEKGCE